MAHQIEPLLKWYEIRAQDEIEKREIQAEQLLARVKAFNRLAEEILAETPAQKSQVDL